MAYFMLFAGLGGGFGGATYQGTYEFETEEQAVEAAYELAVEEYQGTEGCHGLMDWDDCEQDLRESFDYEPSEEDINTHYWENVESWISYYVRPADGPNHQPEE